MPVLDLDHPGPLELTFGTMLYPGSNEEDRRKARTFASRQLIEPIRQALATGRVVDVEMRARLHDESGENIDDWEARRDRGQWVGDIYKTYYALAQSHSEYASLENAIRGAELASTRAKLPASRTSLTSAKKQFITVAHLWAAWSIRADECSIYPPAFLTEAEILRDWGQNWSPRWAKARPPSTIGRLASTR